VTFILDLLACLTTRLYEENFSQENGIKSDIELTKRIGKLMDASLVKDLAYVQNIFPRDFSFNQAALPDLFEVEVKKEETKV
jgi:hypothetical protein